MCINDYIAEFRTTRNIWFLIKAIILVLKQKRVKELAYGVYCELFFQPSSVTNNSHFLLPHLRENVNCRDFWFSREKLIESFGKEFKVRLLPSTFEAARSESVICNTDCLVVGEYAENSARIAYITRESCTLIDFYNQVSGVRHIHSIVNYFDSGEFLISTGDTCKFLDLWVTDNHKLRFAKRLRKQFAGYTAAIKINNRYFLGTDFSNRPNYIETFEGEKYFYPKKAYKLIVIAFYSIFDRYLVSINSDMPQFGDRKTLSIFDTFERKFVFCDFWDCSEKDSLTI